MGRETAHTSPMLAAAVVILLLDWRLYRASSFVFLYVRYLLFSQPCVCVCEEEGEIQYVYAYVGGRALASFGCFDWQLAWKVVN